MTVRDDIFLALHDAIGWQEGLADAWPEGSPEREDAIVQMNRYKAILRRRYGTTFTALDQKLAKAKLVEMTTLRESAQSSGR
jgi:hypothetical protein